MAQVSSPSQHFYFDERKMHVSLLNFSQPILNFIANKAIQHCDSVGQVQMGIVRQAVLSSTKEKVESSTIAPHIILTGWKFNEVTKCNEPFANMEHVENDECLPEWGELADDYIVESGCTALIDYFKNMQRMYPARTHTTSRIKFQCPTTCVWMHTHICDVFESNQQFVLSGAGCSWDISNYFPNDIVNQVSGTFLAGLVDHVSTQTMWSHRLNHMVTLICPTNGTLLAWGSDPNKNKKKIKNKSKTK